MIDLVWERGFETGLKFQKVCIVGIPFTNLTMKELIKEVDNIIKRKQKKVISLANPEFVVESTKNPKLKKYLNQIHINTADGVGIVLASKILKKPLKERVNGTDFVPEICKLSQKQGYNLYFLGAGPKISKKAKKNLESKYESCKISIFKKDFFDPKIDTEEAIEDINKKKIDILMVCLGCPVQESWIEDNLDRLDVKLIFGGGGALDFYSDKVKRAPKWMQKIGLEWLFRLTQDFSWKRIKRQLNLLVFIWEVFKQKIKL